MGNAAIQVTAAHDTWGSRQNSLASPLNACQTVRCVAASSVAVADTFDTFGRALHAIPVPAAAAAVNGRLAADTAGSERGWKSMEGAVSSTDYEDSRDAIKKAGTAFDNDYSALVSSLIGQSEALDERAATLNAQAATLDRAAAVLRRRAAALNVPITTAPVGNAGVGP